ncbi:MAG: nucleotidyl transferase AbiEii/AbiGii toxin family protein [bacterium]|nr:nucleotidyl transferase AbiEii/AbiGii toxin family protein [bacterium]
MIEEKILQKLAVKYQTKFPTVAREYLQALFLESFYRLPQSERFLFKGGTALRLVFRSPRFSEDLDFSAMTDISIFEDLFIQAAESLQDLGLKPEIETAVKTTGGYVAGLKTNLYGETVPIKIHVSQRKKFTDHGEKIAVSGDYLPLFFIQILDKKRLIGEKVEALMTRQKPRDFYDLYFILRAGLLEPKERSILKQALPVIEKTKIDFNKELKVFLPKTHWLIISSLKKSLLEEIGRMLRD